MARKKTRSQLGKTTRKAQSRSAKRVTGAVGVIVNPEDSTPLELNEVFISLGLAREVFKTDVGGVAT